MVAVALYCRDSPLALLAAVQARLVMVVERLGRSEDAYVCYALKALSAVVVADVDQVIDDVRPEPQALMTSPSRWALPGYRGTHRVLNPCVTFSR